MRRQPCLLLQDTRLAPEDRFRRLPQTSESTLIRAPLTPKPWNQTVAVRSITDTHPQRYIRTM